MSGSIPNNDNDDRVALSILTEPAASIQNKSLSQNDFVKIYDRILADITSPVSSFSNEAFWKDVLSKTCALGFTFQQHETTGNAPSLALANTDFAAPFDSEKAKKHLAATSALLGISQSLSKELTDQVFLELKNQNKAVGSASASASVSASGDDNDDGLSLLGTKRLLLYVRDHHYKRQIDRMRIIAEAIRLEYADEVEGKEELKAACKTFLDNIDKRDSWASSSRETGEGPNDRGLFRILLSLACAPVKMLGREEIYRACELSDDGAANSASPYSYSFTKPDIARMLMTDHLTHCDSDMRTQALEALFVLLYQRIDGGVDRVDYVLLLQGFSAQGFFAGNGIDCGSESPCGNRKSQLAALILSECMSLWRAVDNKDDEMWIDSHPFLSNRDSVRNEIEIIGRQLLQNQLACKVLERRRISIMRSQSSGSSNRDDDKIEAPEAIALLTFGLLIKLCHSHCANENNWASDVSVKGLAVDCVSTANDDCGAFGYLGYIMSCLSPSSQRTNAQSKKFCQIRQIYDYQAFILDEGATTATGDDNDVQEAEEESPSVIYANIGREILVATLSAFRSSISRELSSARVDNLGMFCQLSAKIHCHSDFLCQRFWADWESTPENVDLSESGVISADKADPLVFLMDIAHTVAVRAIETLDSHAEVEDFVSIDYGREEAAILPCLSPLLSMLSSIIPREGDVATIFKTFLPDEMIFACLLGSYHICSKENTSTSLIGEHEEQRKRQLQAAKDCMVSLHLLSNIAAGGSDTICSEWLRQATKSDRVMSSLQGSALLHGIAEASIKNPALEKSYALDISAEALYAIAYLCSPGSKSVEWTVRAGQCFSTAQDEGFRSFATHINKVTASFCFLLSQLWLCVADIALVGTEANSAEGIIDFMRTSANGTLLVCDIISSLPQSLDPSDIHCSVLIAAFRTITLTLRIIDSIASCHGDGSIRDAAVEIRDGVIHAVATSTSFGANVGFFATAPVLKMINSFGKKEGRNEASSSRSIVVALASSEEKKELCCETLQLEYLHPPHKFDESTKRTLDISRGALGLLKAWSNVSEKAAITGMNIGLNGHNLQDVTDSLTQPQKESVASFLVLVGPSRLFLSSVSNPVDATFTFCTLLAKFIGWSLVTTPSVSSNFSDIAISSVELLTATLFHSELESVCKQNCVSTFTPSSTHSIGTQIHIALRMLLDMTTDTRGERLTLLLSKILDLLRLSVRFHPPLGKLILRGTSDEDSLVELLLEKLELQDPANCKSSMITSCALEVFQQLWASCRSHCNISLDSKLVKSIHPCDAIVRALGKSQHLIERCKSILNNFSKLASRPSDESAMSENEIYRHCILLRCLCAATAITRIDALADLRNCDNSNSVPSIEFFQMVAQSNQLEQWLKSTECYDGVLLNMRISDDFIQVVDEHKLAFSSIALQDSTAAMFLIDHMTSPSPSTKESLHQAMIAFNASCHLMSLQPKLLTSLSTFGELLVAIIKQQEHTKNESTLMQIAEQVVQNFSEASESGLCAHSHITISSYVVPVSQTMNCGNSLLSLMLSCLPTETKVGLEQEVLITLLDKILRSSERCLILAESSREDVSMNIHLRLSTEVCAISIIDAIMDCSESPKLAKTEELFKSTRLGLWRFSSETLRKLKCSTGIERPIDTSQTLYSYEPNSSNTTVLELNALHSSISLLSALALSLRENKPKAQAYSLQSFQSDLADTLRKSGTLDTLSYHMEMASEFAACTYRKKYDKMAENASFETVHRIVSFASALSETSEATLAQILSSGHFIQLVLKNALLTTACETWNNQLSTEQGSRGYVEITRRMDYVTSQEQRSNMMKDPAHEIWRSTLHTVANFLHATNKAAIGPKDVGIQQHAAALASDFLHFFERPIISFVYKCLSERKKETSVSSSSTPSSGFDFTVATMSELGDIVALISELFSGEHLRCFESSSPRLYQIMSRAALAICRSLSSFLGALGTARELFTALHSFNEVMNKDMNQRSAAMQYQSFSSHPLLADGIPNAKHQAIRNALYASSCCTRITSDEFARSRSSKPSSSEDASEDLEQSFRSHVSNDFIYLMEDLASQCMFSALSVIHQVHPSTSAFITFTQHEATHLNLSSAPPLGAIVAVRDNSGSHIAAQYYSSYEIIRYGRVIHYNSIDKTLDVEYFDNNGCAAERGVGLPRLSALEDISRRINAFQYKPAPESVSDDPALLAGEASIGNLILTLRWCQQHVASQKSETVCRRYSLELNGIANLSAIILGNEIGIHLELGSPTFSKDSEIKAINRQLLSLFDDEDSLQNFDLSSTASTNKSVLLQDVINTEVWRSVQLQLETSLISARVDREVAMKHSEQAGTVGTQYWRRTPTSSSSRSSRRSPFT